MDDPASYLPLILHEVPDASAIRIDSIEEGELCRFDHG